MREELRLTTFEGIKDTFNTIIANMIDQTKLLNQCIGSQFSENFLQRLDKFDTNNDFSSKILRSILLKGIFLPINKHDLQKAIEKFEVLMDLFQRVSHHLWLIELPEWVDNHLKAMLDIIKDQLTCLNNWFTLNKENIEDLDQIAGLENKADETHKKFLQRIFKEELNVKEFSQASLLDQTLEDIADNIEVLARQLQIILYEYKTIIEPPPKYLP